MLERNYDPTLPYRYALYGRMSLAEQNKRSPDQQFDSCEETRQRRDFPWQRVVTYRDDGISGRKISGRPGFQKMLREIELGFIKIDLIVVDTYERLGRADEIGFLRQRLFTDHGIMVVSADTGFSDPTGVMGKAVGMVEQIRSTENTRISRHNVIRGKKDAARLRHWPGGPPAFGLRMRLIVDDSTSPPETFNSLEPEPREAAALLLAFNRAHATGEGAQRLSRWWNTSSEIPDDFKPVNIATMGNRLANQIYVGNLVWGKNRTGIVNDVRVVEPNPEGALVIADFCEAIVPAETFWAVQSLRQARSNVFKESHQTPLGNSGVKLIAPQGRGLTLKYLLTGIVRCPCCDASMRPLASGRLNDGKKRYCYYVCPRHYGGACKNRIHVPEQQLRDAVVSRIRARLFPDSKSAEQFPNWLPELVQLLQQELLHQREQGPDHAECAQREIEEIDRQLLGWGLTLADPSLGPFVRGDICAQYENAKRRRLDLECEAQGRNALDDHLGKMVDPTAVIGYLKDLEGILAGHNPTLCNLELRKHIDNIFCYPDGRIELRGSLLGVFGGAGELLSQTASDPRTGSEEAASDSHGLIARRRRSRLYVPNLSAEGASAAYGQQRVSNANCFEGVPDKFFWSETFVIPRKLSWAETNAAKVFHRRQESWLSFARLASEFGVTPPTIRAALHHYLKVHPNATDCVKLKQSAQRGPRVDVEHFADEAKRLWLEGWSKLELAAKFGYSTPVVDKALAFSYRAQGLPVPNARALSKAKGVEARTLLDAGHPLHEVAKMLDRSTTWIRAQVKELYAGEGRPSPDLRTRESRTLKRRLAAELSSA